VAGVVSLDRVTRHFGSVPAAVDVSLEVRPSEVFGLLGHNGAGKTTLLRLVNGLLEPDSGKVATFGLDPVRHGDEVRRRTGVLTTYPGLDDYLSPAENLAVYGAIHGLPTGVVRERTNDLFARLGIDRASGLPARGLSAGLKQRVALARALVHDPELLLLDEPTANLDPMAAREVRNLIRGLRGSGRTVVFSTHNLAEAESLCDRVAILQHGVLRVVGSLTELAAARFQAGVGFDVELSDVPQAVVLLRTHLNGEASVHADGRTIRVGNVTAEETPALVRLLATSDVDIHRVTPFVPSLEDVYLSLHDPIEAS
jgi:ABC-2 type transport system ATP-binding protein